MNRVDPMNALVSFEAAHRKGMLKAQPGALDTEVFVHLDQPNGEPRFTYVRFKGMAVTAIAVLTPVERLDGLPCFQIGYAVREDQRGQGRAKQIVNSAIAELQNGLARNGAVDYFIEAVVEANNTASRKVAEATLSAHPTEEIDNRTGLQVFHFVKRLGETRNA